MLPSRSSTPRPRQMVIGQSSFTEFAKDPSTPGESRWTALSDTVHDKGPSRSRVESPPVDARPRKRRRIASNDTVATHQADTSMHYRRTSPAHSRLNSSTLLRDSNSDSSSQELCQTCRKSKSNHHCSRCAAPACSVCTRTCTIAAMSTPPTPLLCFSATPSPRPASRRLADDPLDSFESIDMDDLDARLTSSSTSKRRSGASPTRHDDSGRDDTSWWEEPSAGGCGRVVCQSCAVEDSESHESTCLDCLDGFGFS